MIFIKKNIYINHCIERTEHVLEELDISAIKVYVYVYVYVIILSLKSDCLVAILDFLKLLFRCSRVNSIYQTDYVYESPRASKSSERKTISIKSPYISLAA